MCLANRSAAPRAFAKAFGAGRGEQVLRAAETWICYLPLSRGSVGHRPGLEARQPALEPWRQCNDVRRVSSRDFPFPIRAQWPRLENPCVAQTEFRGGQAHPLLESRRTRRAATAGPHRRGATAVLTPAY